MSYSLRPNLPGVTASIGLIPLSMGIYGAIDPIPAMKTAFGWEPPSNAADKRTTLALMKLYSYRSIGLGLAGLATWYSGSKRAQGYVMLTSVVIALGDGLTCYEHSGLLSDGFKHWFSVPIGLGLGSALVGWI